MPESRSIDDHPSLALVRELFPALSCAVEVQFQSDDEFRGLCDDYRACVFAQARFAGEAGGAESFSREYAALRLRLERDLLDRLAERRGV